MAKKGIKKDDSESTHNIRLKTLLNLSDEEIKQWTLERNSIKPRSVKICKECGITYHVTPLIRFLIDKQKIEQKCLECSIKHKGDENMEDVSVGMITFTKSVKNKYPIILKAIKEFNKENKEQLGFLFLKSIKEKDLVLEIHSDQSKILLLQLAVKLDEIVRTVQRCSVKGVKMIKTD